MDQSKAVTIPKMVEAIMAEMQTNDIANHLLKECEGLTETMAPALASGIIGRAITFGYTIPSVIDNVIKEWKLANGY